MSGVNPSSNLFVKRPTAGSSRPVPSSSQAIPTAGPPSRLPPSAGPALRLPPSHSPAIAVELDQPDKVAGEIVRRVFRTFQLFSGLFRPSEVPDFAGLPSDIKATAEAAWKAQEKRKSDEDHQIYQHARDDLAQRLLRLVESIVAPVLEDLKARLAEARTLAATPPTNTLPEGLYVTTQRFEALEARIPISQVEAPSQETLTTVTNYVRTTGDKLAEQLRDFDRGVAGVRQDNRKLQLQLDAALAANKALEAKLEEQKRKTDRHFAEERAARDAMEKQFNERFATFQRQQEQRTVDPRTVSPPATKQEVERIASQRVELQRAVEELKATISLKRPREDDDADVERHPPSDAQLLSRVEAVERHVNGAPKQIAQEVNILRLELERRLYSEKAALETQLHTICSDLAIVKARPAANSEQEAQLANVIEMQRGFVTSTSEAFLAIEQLRTHVDGHTLTINTVRADLDLLNTHLDTLSSKFRESGEQNERMLPELKATVAYLSKALPMIVLTCENYCMEHPEIMAQLRNGNIPPTPPEEASGL